MLKIVLLTILAFSAPARAADKKIALVYNGPGVCVEGCAQAASEPARQSGFTVKFVGPKEADMHIFDDAALWIQPGGGSRSAGRAMTAQLKEKIRSFVRNGGGYVGFCAGVSLAMPKVLDSEIEGLGILPGVQRHKYSETGNSNPTILPVLWNGKRRFVYWEEGSYMTTDKSFKGEVITLYPNKSIATLRLSYGKGRVFVTALHPEAPDFWKTLAKLSDPDGSDIDIAKAMVQWAAE